MMGCCREELFAGVIRRLESLSASRRSPSSSTVRGAPVAIDGVAADLFEDGATMVEVDVDSDAALLLDAEYLNSIS